VGTGTRILTCGGSESVWHSIRILDGKAIILSSTVIIIPTVEALLSSLESEESYCDVAIASNPQAFYRRLSRHPLTLQLVELLQANTDCVEIVLRYAIHVASSTHGTVRSENDAALCACLVALDRTAVRGVDDLIQYLRNSRELALRWPSELAEILSASRVSTIQTETTLARLADSLPADIAGWQMGVTREREAVRDDAVSLV
jgi:hypothetical protein